MAREVEREFRKLREFAESATADDIDKRMETAGSWTSKNLFIETLIENFSHHPDFFLAEKKIRERETILATFRIDDFAIEIFGRDRPTKEQEAYRHMIIEHKILLENPESFRQQIIQLKRSGLSTEEAFAKQLGLPGDPYLELLKIETSA